MNLQNFHLSDVSISCLCRTVLRNLWMVVAAAAILAMSVSLYFDFTYEPVYKGNMTYAVTSRKTSFSPGTNSNAAREVASMLTEMLETDLVRRQIRSQDPKLAAFNGTVQASQVSGTNFVVIEVLDDSPEHAFLALQAVTQVAPELMSYVADNCVVQIIRNPQISAGPVNAVDVDRYCKLAAASGAVAMIALLCWMSLSRETIQTRSAARRRLAAEIIASVHREVSPTLKGRLRRKKKPIHVFSPTTSAAYIDQIRSICTKLEYEATARGKKIFLITGVGENEGKSTIAGNVAAELARQQKKVAILDCDLRNPSLHEFFGKQYSAELPLNEMLAEPFSRENLLRCMQLNEKLNLFMLLPTKPDQRCAELLSGKTMAMLLQQLRVFDYVIVDTPPMGYFADTEVLADQVDATVLVVRQDVTPAPDINDRIDVLCDARSDFLGVVLNRMTSSFTEGNGYGYGYGYYKYGNKKYGYSGKTSSKKSHKH